MPRATDPRPRTASGTGYAIRFLGAAIGLVASTLLLVLVVLPNRYALSSGFRESGISFPTSQDAVPALPLEQRAAAPRPARRAVIDAPAPIGPAEAFWNELIPLLESGRTEAALALFRSYLDKYPEEEGVWREFITTLIQAGRRAEAAEALETLLALGEDADARLLLARTLRDLTWVEAASAEYAILADRGGRDSGLMLEWAQALSWGGYFGEAEAVLTRALAADPDNDALTVEMARVYFASGRLAEAASVLASLDEASLARLNAQSLPGDVAAAMAQAEADQAPPLTLIEQAAVARVGGDYAEASRLLDQALAENSSDVEAWQAYADLLQYELSDLEGALAALQEVEALTADYDAGAQFRVAQLEAWTGRYEAATARLERLLPRVTSSGRVPLNRNDPESALLAASDVRALRADVLRWQGDRVGAAIEYEMALAVDSAHVPATDGLVALRADVDRQIEEVEGPRAGSTGYLLGDTDNFRRFEAAGEWIGVQRDWAWQVRAGNRWLEGFDALGGAAREAGLFAGAQGARWWRWGTIRTALDLGLETLRDGNTDLSFGASARFLDPGGFSLDAGFRHGPAYDLTSTLQSVFASVVQDNLRVTLSGSLTPTWSLWLESQASTLDPSGLPGAGGVTRMEGSAALSGKVTPWLSMGLATSVMGYSEAAPDAGGRSLFWDPERVVALGPFAALSAGFGESWALTGRIAPGVAFIDERSSTDTERVPQFSAEAGIRHKGDHLWSAVDLFMVQGKFDGYRAWGARLSLSLRQRPMGGVSR